MPKVSVIVPVYNVEQFLGKCVQSLRNQTLQDIEIILVDDQSPDNCPQMCDKYMELDHRIKVIHKKNEGLGYARNSGLEIASGEYVAFVDSDDYVDLEMYETMYNAAIKVKADFVRVDNYKERMDGTILNMNYEPPMREGIYERNELREKLLFTQLGMEPSDSGERYVSCSVWRNIYRKEIIDRLGLRFISERELISEDIPFNMDFMMSCDRAVVINHKFYHYIVNDKSLTQSYRSDRFECELELYHNLIEKAKTMDIYDECQVRLERHLMSRTRTCIKLELTGNKIIRVGFRNVKKMLESEELQKFFSTYPYRKLPYKYRVLYYLMRYKCIFILYILKSIL